MVSAETWSCDPNWAVSDTDSNDCRVTLGQDKKYYLFRDYSYSASDQGTGSGLSQTIRFSNFSWNIPDDLQVSGVSMKVTKLYQPQVINNQYSYFYTSGIFDWSVRLVKQNGDKSANHGQLPPYRLTDNGVNYRFCFNEYQPVNSGRCNAGRVDWAQSNIKWSYGGPNDHWNGEGRTGQARERGDWTGQLLTLDEIRDPNFGVELSVVLDDESSGSIWLGPAPNNNKIAILQSLSLTFHSERSWSLQSITPSSGPSLNPPDVVIHAPGVFNTGQLVCRWTFPDTSVTDLPATLINNTHVQCSTPSNHGEPGTAKVDVSLDGGKTFSGFSLNFIFLVSCNPPCQNGATCNNATGRCNPCGIGIYGESCEFRCDSIANINSCDQCRLRSNSHCPFCLRTMTCGPCNGSTIANPFLIGPNIQFPVERCLSAAILNVSSLQNPTSNDSFVEVSGSDFLTTIPMWCEFVGVSRTAATVISPSKLSCRIPPNPSVPKNQEIAVNVKIVTRAEDGNFINIGQNSFIFTYGQFISQRGEKSVNQVTVGEIFAYIAAAIAVIGLCCFLCIGKYSAHRKAIADDKYRSLYAIPEFSLEAAFGSIYNISSSVSRSMEKQSDLWEEFARVVSGCDYFFMDFVGTEMESIQDDVVRACVYIYENKGQTINFMHHAISHQVKYCETPKNLFRGANFASKAWSGWIRMSHGLYFLHRSIANPLYEVCSALGDRGVELNPASLGADSSAGIDKYRLLSSAQLILSSIFDNGEFIPAPLQIVLNSVRTAVHSKFPEYDSKMLGGFLFLRFFCPAIASPVTYGLLSEEPGDSARRLLVLISKSLMNLANGIQFGVKEEYMQTLNDFIVENNAPCIDYLLNIASLNDASDSDSDEDIDFDPSTPFDGTSVFTETELEPEQLPTDVYEISLILLHKFFLENKKKLLDSLENLPLESTAQEIKPLLEQLEEHSLELIEDDFF